MRKFFVGSLFMLVISFSVHAQTFSLVKDINPGTNNSLPGNLAAINGKIFFKADDGVHGPECWISDGTEAGTVLFKDINPGVGGSAPAGFTRMGSVIYFIATDGTHGSELWKTNGTEAGTVMVKDINPGTGGSSLSSFVMMSNKLFFVATDGTHGIELWKTDGTEDGTVMIKDINTATSSSFPGNNAYPAELTIWNNSLYFSAANASGSFGLWKSDGTEAGTTLVSLGDIGIIRNINNTLLFSLGNSLRKSDGTATGTVAIKSTGIINSLIDINGTAFFYTVGAGTNITIWKSDGTTAGTVQVKSIIGSGSFTVGYFTDVNGKLFFVAPHPTGGSELWTCDGTEAGTVMVKDIYPGANTSEPFALTAINDKLYFSATNGTFGKEIWRSDGTGEGTVLMQDIANPGNASPLEFTLLGTKLFVSATDNIHGRELWVAELTTPAGGLPLTILDFKGRLVSANALLSWKTVAEHNTSHFEIERSIDGRVFSKIATLNAAGNSTITKLYDYTDRNVTLLGTNAVFYRLKMTDLDGKFTYSRITAININNPETVIMFYPNPVTENATLMMASLKNENISYRIIDQHGRVMQHKNISIAEGSNMINIETAMLASCIYTIELKGPVINKHLKFVKQ